MLLKGKAIIHVFDISTHFNATSFLPGQTVGHICMAFIEFWVTLYPGFSNNLPTDQGSFFTSNRWNKLCEFSGVTLQLLGI